MGGTYIDNLLTIKVVLKSFDLASGVKVNFVESCMFGVNVDRIFLDLVEDFLHYKVSSFPFKYCGLLLGENPKKK